MSALTAAFELAKCNVSRSPPRYDITVYQQGWRLGGKGASGRNAVCGQRIEEHGLHVWFGAYENAFRTMKDVYARGQPPTQLKDSFQEQYGFSLMEQLRGEWTPWHFPLPPRARSAPGDGNAQGQCTPQGVLHRLAYLVYEYYASKLYASLSTVANRHAALHGDGAVPPVPTPSQLRSLAESLQKASLAPSAAERERIADAYSRFRDDLAYHANVLLETASIRGDPQLFGDALRHAWIIVTVGIAVLKGTVTSKAYSRDDWDALNCIDLKVWLRLHLGALAWMADSALVEACYDLYFSYPGGNTQQGDIEAGSMLRAAVWLLLEYKGAFMWRMRNGMGDAIFAPLYNVLSDMDVKFAFFHKVLNLSTDGARVTGITIERQASLRGDVSLYYPFVQDPMGCECWPWRPNFAQLAQGFDLEAGWEKGYNLESDWSTWQAKLSDLELQVGTHFDQVVLGVPIDVLRTVCSDFRKFDTMLAEVKTVQTQALQLWLTQSLPWLRAGSPPFVEAPLLTTFQNPIDTYADMTHLVGHEDWPPGAPALHIAYFCGVLEDRTPGTKPSDDPDYLDWANKQVRTQALQLFEASATASAAGLGPPMRDLWPKAFQGGKMKWDLLCVDTSSRADSLDQQFMRCNVDASERYVLAATGTSHYRLKAGGSGYSNLYLAGDWVNNGLFLGCIEGAVIAGKQAARALSGEPIEVVGEGNLFKRP